jgi:hypothetical protein
MWFFLIDGVIQEDVLYVYNIHNIEVKHLSTSIAYVRSRGESLGRNRKTKEIQQSYIFLEAFSLCAL